MDDIIDLISDSDEDSTADNATNAEDDSRDDGQSDTPRASDDNTASSGDDRIPLKQLALKERLRQQARTEEPYKDRYVRA